MSSLVIEFKGIDANANNIQVDVKKTSVQVSITVSDDGDGISSEDLLYVGKIRSSTTKQSGSKYGHKGEVSNEYSLMLGASFTHADVRLGNHYAY